jgi:hypothetical protein
MFLDDVFALRGGVPRSGLDKLRCTVCFSPEQRCLYLSVCSGPAQRIFKPPTAAVVLNTTGGPLPTPSKLRNERLAAVIKKSRVIGLMTSTFRMKVGSGAKTPGRHV